VRNVLWSWLGVAVTIASGILLSPYLIRKLGDEGYGVWVLVFGLIENYWLFDLGFRSATVKYSAHYRATGETEKINELINTGVVYFSVVALGLFAGSIALARHVNRLFQVSPELRPDFSFLIALVGTSWAFGMIFNMFTACLEGFQHFGLSSRIAISATVVRVAGTAILLFLGHGLIALGFLVVGSQAFAYTLSILALRRVFPEQRFSLRLAKFSMFRQMVSYGVHTLTGGVATQLLNQGAPLLIGHFRPAAFVGYFSVPVRLLQYTGDAVDRVGLITSSSAAELTARNEHDAIPRLGIFVNRYCLSLFLPVAVFLLFYGSELIRVWIRKPDFVAMSAPLLPVLLIGTTLAIAGQVNSSSILYGMAKHRGYARGLLVEGIALVASLYFVVPQYGILGAAWVTSVLMVLDRGLFTPWLLCRHLNFGFGLYVRSIYLNPMLTALPAAAVAYGLKSAVLPGDNLIQVLAAAVLIAAAFYPVAFFSCVDPRHRPLVLGWIAKRSKAFAAA
jgi:O-antigen/teichoic acid export membrane protein